MGFALCSCPRGGRAEGQGKGKVPEVCLMPLVSNCVHGDFGLEILWWLGGGKNLLVPCGLTIVVSALGCVSAW